MILALLLLCQDAVEMKEFKASYLVAKPAAYVDTASWAVVVDLGDRKNPAREPDAFVIAPVGRQDEAFVLACLQDLKTRFRINPETVYARGPSAALTLASEHPELFAGCAVERAKAFMPPKKAPPCAIFLSPSDPDGARVLAAAMVMKKGGVDIRILESGDQPGAVCGALKGRTRVRGDLPFADELQRQGRFLDASLVCIDLLDNPEVERLARTKLKSIEGAAIIELAKVEISMADRKYKDAILRCRDAARQFAWVPSGERIRKRLGELESRPEVKKAMQTDD
ncbi:MAG TPA: hypothetical protein VM222_06975 [Planctomycetota bacterium]|nr:hypothetical protein [Planctomycetota bacterium]